MLEPSNLSNYLPDFFELWDSDSSLLSYWIAISYYPTVTFLTIEEDARLLGMLLSYWEIAGMVPSFSSEISSIPEFSANLSGVFVLFCLERVVWKRDFIVCYFFILACPFGRTILKLLLVFLCWKVLLFVILVFDPPSVESCGESVFLLLLRVGLLTDSVRYFSILS